MSGPEFRFGPLRVAVLVSLVIGFALADGFTVPAGASPVPMRRWALSVLLFAAGAVAATLVDLRSGRTNLRWFLIVMGTAAMAGAFLIQRSVRSENEGQGKPNQLAPPSLRSR